MRKLAAALLLFATGFVKTEPPVVYRDVGARAHRATETRRSVAHLPGWQGVFDLDTGVPLRIYGPPVAAFGAVADARVAEQAARAFVAAHLDTLAPGAAMSDLVLVANQLDGDLRTVAFAQRAGGLPVIGGGIGVEIENDRIFSVTSTALPHVQVAAPTPAPVSFAGQAEVWLASDGIAARAEAKTTRMILPLVRHGDVRFALVEQLRAGAYDVYLDASSGAPVARASRIRAATGTVMFDVPDQSPSGTRSPHPAPFAVYTIAGTGVESAFDGSVIWDGAAATTVQVATTGPLVDVRPSTGAAITAGLPLAPGGSVTWSAAATPNQDAQLDAYVYANEAKAFAKARLNPTLPFFGQQLPVVVDENDTCNAYSTGNDIHFFIANSQCENTGRIRDVVFHEFGHSVHDHSYIPGVGAFDSSLSEGLADTLAVSITGDHGLGRGFFFDDEPLRDVDPVGLEKRWPQDADGEPHDEGEIIGETLWDLRKALIAQDGQDAGFAKLLKLYYGVMQRASDIPASYLAALVTDDDDGDLTNGTPDLCAINAAFGAHGLADPAYELKLTPPTRSDYAIHFSADPSAASQCPNPPSISSAVVAWHVDNGGLDSDLAFAPTGTDFVANIPTQADGTLVQYKVTITLSDGTSLTYPDNAADPYYAFYVGPVTKLYCTDFESGAADWTHGGTKDDWQAGAPMGLGGDPTGAHGGTGAFGTDLSTDGQYKPSANEWAKSPVVDTSGYDHVRLQYWRWLDVDKNASDRAVISANDAQVWHNAKSAAHVDKEWRFADVDLGAPGASVQLQFQLASNADGNLGGWTIDDLCVVGVGAKTVPTSPPDAGVPTTMPDAGDPNNDLQPVGHAGGCSTSSPGVGLALLALGLVRRRRGAR